MDSSLLVFKSVSFSYAKNGFNLKNINFTLYKGDFCCVIGRNGSGKSTLIKLAAGLYKPDEGEIFFKNKPLNFFKGKELAKNVSYLPQQTVFNQGNTTVYDLLLTARYAYKAGFDFMNTVKDYDAADSALEILGIEDFKYRIAGALSGGEKQKVLIAMSFVQLDLNSDLSEKLLIIDEPLTYLDVNYQFEIFSVLAKLNVQKKLTVLFVTHDLNIAIKYSGNAVLMDKGNIINYGKSSDIINSNSLKEYFMINSRIVEFENEYHINFFPNKN